MRSLHWGQCLAVPLGLMLVMIGVVRLGLAVRSGEVVPPALDVRIAHMRITASVSQNPDCPPHIQCPLQAGAPAQAYVVVWSVDELPTADRLSGQTAHRLLIMPLRR